jgi:hypothetical protein
MLLLDHHNLTKRLQLSITSLKYTAHQLFLTRMKFLATNMLRRLSSNFLFRCISISTYVSDYIASNEARSSFSYLLRNIQENESLET